MAVTAAVFGLVGALIGGLLLVPSAPAWQSKL
jgi:hypothetical protein